MYCLSISSLSIHLFIYVCGHTCINTQTNLDFYICSLIWKKKNLKNSGEIFICPYFYSMFYCLQTVLLENFVSRYNLTAFHQWVEQVLTLTVHSPHRWRSLLAVFSFPWFSCSGSKTLSSFSMALPIQVTVLHADAQHGQRDALSSSCAGHPSPLQWDRTAFSASVLQKHQVGIVPYSSMEREWQQIAENM